MKLLKTMLNTISRRKTILAVDDQPDMLDTLKKLLKYEYHVYGVTTHTAALKFLEKKTPDLILLDIEMPGMDGIELLKVLRGMGKLKNVPIVFVTSKSSMANLEHVAQGDGDGFIKKPVDYKFVERIKKYFKDK